MLGQWHRAATAITCQWLLGSQDCSQLHGPQATTTTTSQPTDIGGGRRLQPEGGEHCLAPGNNTGIRGLLPSINVVVALDTVASVAIGVDGLIEQLNSVAGLSDDGSRDSRFSNSMQERDACPPTERVKIRLLQFHTWIPNQWRFTALSSVRSSWCCRCHLFLCYASFQDRVLT